MILISSLLDHLPLAKRVFEPLHGGSFERMFVLVDRLYELENLRRSLAMLPPGSKSLDREEAMRLLADLHEVESRLRNLRDALRAVLDHGLDR